MIKRLLRDLKSHLGWVIAIVILIALSTAFYSSFRSVYDSGLTVLESANDDLNSADIIISTMPTIDYSSDLELFPGISEVSAGFMTECYSYDNATRIRGVVTSVPIGVRVNNYEILSGDDLNATNAIVVEHHYASQHNIEIGQELALYIFGNATTFNVSGICFSPEYIYLISPEGSVELDFGIFFVCEETIIPFVNTFYCKVSDMSKISAVVSDLESFFTAQGISAVVKQVNQSFIYLAFREDLKAVSSLANIFTIILLAISAFIIFVVLARLVEKKRQEIGILRAMGFTKRSIFFYYLLFASIASSIGILLSIPLAYGFLSLIMNYWGNNILGIPSQFITYNLHFAYFGYGVIFAVVFTIIGAFFPAFHASSLTPVIAMKSYITSKKSARILNKSSISVTRKLFLRDIFGHKARSISTVIAIAMLLSLGMSFALSMNTFNEGINQRFDEYEMWDIKVSFNTLQNNSIIPVFTGTPHILSAEPYLGSGAEISYENKSIVIQLNQLIENTTMRKFSSTEGAVITDNVILSGDVVYRLGLSINDTVSLATPSGRREINISAILHEFSSSEGYILTNLVNFTGLYLKVDTDQILQIEESLKNMPFVKSWVLKNDYREGWLQLMTEYTAMTYPMDFLTIILTIMLVGIIVLLSTMEREWEFVILKTLGFSNWTILLNEFLKILLFSSLGISLSIPIAIQLSDLFAFTFRNLISPLNTIPVPDTMLSRSFIVLGASLLTVLVTTTLILKRNIAERLRNAFETI